MTMPERSLAASAAEPSRFPSSGSSPSARADHDRMANAIRALAMDAVEQAKSGHPGLPMGAADIATVLFTRFLKFDPADPAWPCLLYTSLVVVALSALGGIGLALIASP